MSADFEQLTLIIAGQQHSEWASYWVDSNLLTPADGWRVTLAAPRGLPDYVRPGAPAVLKIGADIIMTGRIDRVCDRLNRDGDRHGARVVMLEGRDNAAVLVDCSAPVFTTLEADLTETVQKIVKPLGLDRVRIDADKTVKRERINIEPGDTAWQALQNAAEAQGLWPWMEPDGTLVVGGPDYMQEPVATLVCRCDGQGNNISTIDVQRDNSRTYSEITVLSQSHAGADHAGQPALRATWSNPACQQYRPRIVVDHEADSSQAAKARARKLMADARLQAFCIRIAVAGHRIAPNQPGAGRLWQPGQRVRVISEPHRLDAVYFLMARQFEGGKKAPTVTHLELREDEMWIVEAHGHKRKRRGKNGIEADIPIEAFK